MNAAFAELLQLPQAERRHRSTYAAFMLRDARRLQQLVRDGFYDDKHLAIFLLGEDGKRALDAGDPVTAVHLYAQQAATGDSSGAVSLLFVARRIAADPASVTKVLRDPVGVRLLAAFYYARHDELADAAMLWPALRAAGLATGAGAHLLAAAAYRDGTWDDAAMFAARAPDEVLSRWVRGKLALRDGDTATARRYLELVEAAHPERCGLDDADPPDPLARVRGELGLVALRDGRLADAVRWLRAGNHLQEAAYVAERVMTPDDLSHLVPAPAAIPYQTCTWVDDPAQQRACWDRDLPTLYARRMMRLGRYDEALRYFDPTLRTWAEQYVMQMTGTDDLDAAGRAERLIAASHVVREHGMELFGTDGAPDWAMFEGDYEREHACGPGETPKRDDNGEPLWGECVPPTPADLRYYGPDETARVASSAPPVDRRFHYRFVASRLAEQAADLLPERSQAYAESLCWAARYVEYSDQARFHTLYDRYVRTGAYGFGPAFGQDCEAPDFERARTFWDDHAPPSRWQIWRGRIERRPWLWLGPLAVLALLGSIVARRRIDDLRRHPASPP
jgi:hypothetical protein